MAAKKATAGAAKPKSTAAPVHGSYKDMIRDAIINLKDRNGSSRTNLKKYVQANNNGIEPGAAFDNMFNKAIKSGVDKGEFSQPKGPSGTVKLAKQDSAAAKTTTASKNPSAAKNTKPAAPKKASAPKKSDATPKKSDSRKPKAAAKTKSAPKKASTTTKKTAAVGRPKANTGKARKSKAPAPAPAVIDTKKVLGKTKSGRVTKGPAKPSKPAPKKASTPSKKKSTTATGTPGKRGAPKKSTTPTAAAAAGT
ncbi:MAG: hypothetical protein Q9163_006170 [Psora crenata]